MPADEPFVFYKNLLTLLRGASRERWGDPMDVKDEWIDIASENHRLAFPKAHDFTLHPEKLVCDRHPELPCVPVFNAGFA